MPKFNVDATVKLLPQDVFETDEYEEKAGKKVLKMKHVWGWPSSPLDMARSRRAFSVDAALSLALCQMHESPLLRLNQAKWLLEASKREMLTICIPYSFKMRPAETVRMALSLADKLTKYGPEVSCVDQVRGYHAEPVHHSNLCAAA